MYRVATQNGKAAHIIDEFASNETKTVTLCSKEFDTADVHVEDDLPDCEVCNNKFS